MAIVHRLGQLAEHVGGKVVGDATRPIHGIATLEEAGADQLSFLTNSKYRDQAQATAAGALLVAPGTDLSGRDLLEVRDPYVALARLLALFHPPPRRRPGVSVDARIGQEVQLGQQIVVGPFAVIEDRVRLGDRAVVGPGCVVGEGSVLGEASELRACVVLYPGTRVGRRSIIHSGVVLGADGFGFATCGGKHHKVPQVGCVEIGDDVEIGANTTVDRAMLGTTRVGAGSKVDNLVMIAHGVQIGEASLLAAQSGVAGSTRLGRGCVLAGQAGVAGHLRVGDEVKVAAKSAVLEGKPDGSFVAGIPAFDHRVWRRAQALYRRLPDLWRELRELRSRLADLEDRVERKE